MKLIKAQTTQFGFICHFKDTADILQLCFSFSVKGIISKAIIYVKRNNK